VKHSLFIALLDKSWDESLFWAFELYFSGFEEETYLYLMEIYEQLYEKENPKLRTLLEKTHIDQPAEIGTIVATLVNRPYSLTGFMETFFQVRCCETPSEKKMKYVVHLKTEDLLPYQTRPCGLTVPRLYLRQVCRYDIHKHIQTLFKCPVVDFAQPYYMNWLYYAARSPVWAGRIAEFGGEVDDDNEQVVFPDDDAHEEFHLKWEFEPDEQPLDVQQNSNGKPNVAHDNKTEF
jgi:hypothetical protein